MKYSCNGLDVGSNTLSALVSTRNTPWKCTVSVARAVSPVMTTSRSITGRGPPGTIRMRPQNRGAPTESVLDAENEALAAPAPVATAPTSPDPLSDIIEPSWSWMVAATSARSSSGVTPSAHARPIRPARATADRYRK